MKSPRSNSQENSIQIINFNFMFKITGDILVRGSEPLNVLEPRYSNTSVLNYMGSDPR